jgi:hypothetical protein
VGPFELGSLGPRRLDPVEAGPARRGERSLDRLDPARVLRMGTGEVLERSGM